jgi:hypothetical protein
LQIPNSDFNWLGIADILAVEARNRKDTSEKIQLAELAVTIYERLAKHDNPEHADSNINSVIALSVYMLANHYIDPSHSILGLGQIMKHLGEVTGISPSEANELSKGLKEKLKVRASLSPSDLEKMEVLRRIKNKLTLLKRLPSDILLKKSLNIEAWLEIYNQLP